MAKRKIRTDSKGRALQKGECQRKSDGRYIYTYYDIVGHRCFIYANSLRELREKENHLEDLSQSGIDIYRSNHVILNDEFDLYMSLKSNLRGNSQALYQTAYDKHVRNTIGFRLLRDFRYTDIRVFYQRLIDVDKISYGYLCLIDAVLGPVFDLAMRDDLILKNPTDGVLPELRWNHVLQKRKRHALTMDQQKAFLSVFSDTPEFSAYYPFFAVLLGTGMRFGEAAGLTWSDVDFDNRLICISHQVIRVKPDGSHGLNITPPKTENGNRSIPMMNSVYKILREEYKKQEATGFCPLQVDGYQGFVFFSMHGNLLCNSTCNETLHKIRQWYNSREIRRAEQNKRKPELLPDMTCHTLRHTFCSRLCESGMNLKMIQQIMGHGNISVTMNIYTECDLKKTEEELKKISKSLDMFF